MYLFLRHQQQIRQESLISFCPLIMPAGRPKRGDPGALYAFAHQFYWDFRRLDEGSSRWWTDKKKYEQLAAGAEKNAQLGDAQRFRAREVAEEESQLFETLEWVRWTAAEQARKQVKIPGEPDVFDALLRAETPEQVREICKDAFVERVLEVAPGVTRNVQVPNWPISAGRLPLYLSQYASELIAAKNDPRFPQSTRRPSSRLKQLWFLSRALAGALYGVRARTAINLVGSLRPEQVFREARDGKPARRQRKPRHKP